MSTEKQQNLVTFQQKLLFFFELKFRLTNEFVEEKKKTTK